MSRAIGILGGTFDPVHFGHLIAATWALEELALDRLLLIPNNQSPLKAPGPVASFTDRIAMVTCALASTPRLLVSDIEGRRGGVSYTVDTLRRVQEDYPDAQLSLILGSDALHDFDSWHDHLTVARIARIVGIIRGNQGALLPDVVQHVLSMPRIDISSSLIRQRIAAGQSIAFLTPDAVVSYIREHRLYGPR